MFRVHNQSNAIESDEAEEGMRPGADRFSERGAQGSPFRFRARIGPWTHSSSSSKTNHPIEDEDEQDDEEETEAHGESEAS